MGGGVNERALKDSAAWEHMKKLVQHIVTERPQQATETMESISSLVHSGSIVPAKVTTVYNDQCPKPTRAVPAHAQKAQTAWALKASHQIVPPKPARKPVEDDEEPMEEEEPEEDKGELPDIAAEQAILNKFGEGLPPEEAFRVAVALKRLLDTEPLAKVRFWGRVFGQKRNYYIAETRIDESRVPEKEEEDIEEEEQEGKAPETIVHGLAGYRAPAPTKVLAEEAKGINENTYYVATSDDLTTWARLPDVLPAHIIGARAIHKLFSGDLDAPVDCQPPFPGTERHYLRAQIARISCSCTVCPKDMYTTEGAEEEEEEDEDGNKIPKRFEVKPYDEIPPLNPQDVPDADDIEAVTPVKMWFFGYKNDELLEVANWVHIAPTLLKEGRATKFHSEEEPPIDDDEEEDDTVPEEGVVPPASQEFINPFLSDLSHDRLMELSSHSKTFPCWGMRKAFSNPSDTTRVYLARSLLWSGAMCYAVAEDDVPGAQFQNFYNGYGTKAMDAVVYAPALPPRRCVEFPTSGIKLMKDCTYDDELEFEPTPPVPKVKKDEDEEDEE